MKLIYKENYFEDHGKKYDYLSDEDFARIKQFLPSMASNIKILELGCGSCAFGQRVQEIIPGSSLVGIDICLPLLRWSSAPCCQADVIVLPFKDESFDCVLVAGAFHHFPNIMKAVLESYRCLRDGGVLFAYEPNKLHPHRFICMTDPFRHFFYKTGDHCISPYWFRKKLKETGFSDIDIDFIAFSGNGSSMTSRFNLILTKIVNNRLKILSPFVAPWFVITAVKKSVNKKSANVT